MDITRGANITWCRWMTIKTWHIFGATNWTYGSIFLGNKKRLWLYFFLNSVCFYDFFDVSPANLCSRFCYPPKQKIQTNTMCIHSCCSCDDHLYTDSFVRDAHSRMFTVSMHKFQEKLKHSIATEKFNSHHPLQ